MTAWIETRNQLGLIETSLKMLKDSKHVGELEFRDMYSAMEQHHRNYKLAHLTGIAKDVLEQGRQDTRFYVILAKMLTEVTSVDHDNLDGLQKVYAWYESNRHTLHTKPKFGKGKKDSKRNLSARKSTSSALSETVSAKNKLNNRQHLSTKDYVDVTVSDQDLPPCDNRIVDSTVDKTLSDTKYVKQQRQQQQQQVQQQDKEHQQQQQTQQQQQQIDQSVIEESLLPKRKPLPLTHIFNPLSRALEEMEKQQNSEVEPSVKLHVSPRGTIRSTNSPMLPLMKWEEYLKENTVGQDILSKLQHVGRSGVPGTVRYAAHEKGLLAEDLTQDIINAYVQYTRPRDTEVDDTLIKQPLEEFYKATEGHYPVHRSKLQSRATSRNKHPKSATSRVGSAMSKDDPETRTARARSAKSNSKADEVEHQAESVKLDTVVNMIDSVTDEMTQHKEKLITEPTSGFRQPTTPVDPDFKLDAAPPGSLARPSSPTLQGKNDLRETLSQSVDWRGRVTPDPAKHKWKKSGLGGHSFVKKTQRPKTSQVSLRSAGSVVLNRRPTTAPTPAKQRWGTHNPSDHNTRAPCQAATHVTMEVDEKATNELINVRHLDSSGAVRRPRSAKLGDLDFSFMGSNFSLEQELLMLRSDLRPFTCPTSTTPVEYVNISAPKTLQDSRAVSAGNKPRTKYAFNQRDSMQALPAPERQADFLPLTCNFDRSKHQKQQNDKPMEDNFVFLTDEDGIKQSCAQHNNTERSSGRTEQVDENIEDSRRILAEITQLLKQTDHGTAEGDLSEPAPPPPSVKLSDHNDVGYELEISGQQLYSGPSVKSDEQRHANENAKRFSEPRRPFVYSDECVKVLPDIDPMPRDIDVDQYVKERERKNTQIPNQHVKLATAYRQRVFQRTFPRQTTDADITQETVQSLNIEGRGSKASRDKMRTAGTVPSRAKSASYGKILQKQDEMLKRAPATASRTSPSIPMPCYVHRLNTKQPYKGKAFSPELDSHARKDRNPKHFMEKEQNTPPTHRATSELILGMTNPYQRGAVVRKMLLNDKQSTVLYAKEALHHSVGGLRVGDILSPAPTPENDNYLQGSLTVSRFVDTRKHGKLDANGKQNDANGSDSASSHSDTSSDSKMIRIHITHKQSRDTPDISKIGRPIPDYGTVQTPEEYQEEMRKQKIAKAAVDIQRIFRGYVVRNQYKYLRREIRERKEDERKAELKKQQNYIEHLERVNNIYNRDPDLESQEWKIRYEQQLLEEESRRNAKAQNTRAEHAMNKATADATLSVIGPHVEVYVPFHPKKIGPDKATFHRAACLVQKIVRGWLVRIRMDRLKRKSKWHASSWSKFTNQYRELLKRIQLRSGIQRPKTPFCYAEINEFMDLKKRYESVFEKRAFGGELEVQELIEYFHECDLYPTVMELDEAFDSVFRGQSVKKGRGLYKHEVLELTFQLYPPRGTGIVNQHKSSWMNPIIDGEEANKLLGSESVESTDFQTCWNLVAASRRERKEKEKKKEREELDRKLEEQILWQKGKESSGMANNAGDDDNTENKAVGEIGSDTKDKTVKGTVTRSKVRFDDGVKEQEEKSDIQQSTEFPVPREVSLEGILDAIEREEETGN